MLSLSRRRSRRRRRGGPRGGEPLRVKPPFPFSLFTNIRLFYIIGIVALALGLIPVIFATRGRSASPPEATLPTVTATPPSNTTPADNEATATPRPTPAKRYAAPPAMTIDPERSYFAVIQTEKGRIRLELFAKDAPQAVNSFVFLAREGFYDGLTFYRVVPGFVAQTGDPTGSGSGGPGYTIAKEANEHSHTAGAVAMARRGSAIDGGQFYILYSSQPHLDGEDSVFGRVVEGMDVLWSLTPRDPQDAAAPPGDRIITITIEES